MVSIPERIPESATATAQAGKDNMAVELGEEGDDMSKVELLGEAGGINGSGRGVPRMGR